MAGRPGGQGGYAGEDAVLMEATQQALNPFEVSSQQRRALTRL